MSASARVELDAKSIELIRMLEVIRVKTPGTAEAFESAIRDVYDVIIKGVISD